MQIIIGDSANGTGQSATITRLNMRTQTITWLQADVTVSGHVALARSLLVGNCAPNTLQQKSGALKRWRHAYLALHPGTLGNYNRCSLLRGLFAFHLGRVDRDSRVDFIPNGDGGGLRRRRGLMRWASGRA